MLPANGPSRADAPRAGPVAGDSRMLARRPASVLILALLPALAPAQGRPAARPAGDVPAGYERRTILGFTVLASRDVLDQPRDRYGRKPLDVLEMELYDLKRVVVPP